MILLLVIAMLVLLALMGTIFILMASTDRKSAYASNSSASLNMAQQGVLNTVRGLMLNGTLDQPVTSAGGSSPQQTLAVGVYDTSAGTPQAGYPVGFTPDQYNSTSKTGGQIARFWDYPEVGAMPSTTDTNGFYQSATVGAPPTPTQYAPSEPWLVSNQPYEPNDIQGTTTPQTLYVPGEEVYYATENTASPFNATGVGRQVYTGTANIAPPTGWTSTPTVAYATASAQTSTRVPLISTLSPYLYDPSTGTYIIPWQVAGTVTPGGPISVPNAAVVEPRWAYNTAYNPALAESAGNMPVTPTGTLDAMWNLLPYSSPNGTRYRFATRIIDMSSMLNLNAGWIPSADPNSTTDSPYAQYGGFIASCPILNSVVNASAADLPSSEGGLSTNSGPQYNAQYVQGNWSTSTASPQSPAGREGTYAAVSTGYYSLQNWQNALNEYEIQYPNSASPPTAYSAFFGANSEMDLLTAAGAGGAPFGSPYYSRVATLLPNTLGLLYPSDNYYGSGYRSLYTTYSWGRDVAAVNPGTSTTGTAPPKLNLNATIPTATPFATFAQNLYNTLIACGYQPTHACAFLANYFTYRYGTNSGTAAFVPATLVVTSTGTSATLTAPSTSALGTATLTLAAGAPANATFVGNSAQPFLNEAEVELQPQAGGAAPTTTDWAIEVVNPFPSLSGNAISMSNGASANYTVTITASTGGTPLTIPLAGTKTVNPSLQGYSPATNTCIGVVCLSGGGYSAAASKLGDGFVYPVSGALPPAAATGTVYTITLTRDNLPGGATAVVDSMTLNVPGNIVPDANNGPVYADASRDNAGLSDGIWGCDTLAQSNAPGTLPTTDPGTIGTYNGLVVAAGGGPGVPLYDRFFTGASAAAPGTKLAATLDSNEDLLNVDDLNCVARESTTSVEPLTQQIGTNSAATSGAAIATYPANLGMYYADQANAATDPMILVPTGAAKGTVSPEVTESALYFDFAYDPRAAYTVADAGFTDPVVTANGGTAGEVPPTILSMTTLTDRSQSNTAAASALPEGNADLVRQAGKININTAGPDVLYSIFSNNGAMSGDTTPVQQSLDISALVDDAIAFRERLALSATGLPLFAVTTGAVAVTTVANANNYSIYGGTGFRSNADLLVALLPTIESGKFPTGQMAAPTTLQQRDAAWADVENFITVRSDTFAVYGLVQALRLNPAYITAGAAYTPTDWYNANQGILVGTGATYNPGSISTDPTNQNAEFILRGSRRFIAIVDRSYCNNGATVQPHIVALKILPQ